MSYNMKTLWVVVFLLLIAMSTLISAQGDSTAEPAEEEDYNQYYDEDYDDYDEYYEEKSQDQLEPGSGGDNDYSYSYSEYTVSISLMKKL